MVDATLLRAVSDDRALGSSILFKHRHSDASPDFHLEILDLWRAADPFVLVEAFREAGKSTLAEEFLCMEGCFGNFRYCIIFGETYAKACQRLESIAYEAVRNIKLKAMFGKVLAKKPIENKVWFESGALLEAAGWEQEVTGFKYLDARPDRVYLDDVENLERVRDSEAVDASMRKLYREIIPAMDKRGKLRFTQTPRAVDCMNTRLRDNPEWVVRAFPLCDGDIDDARTQALWPARYPMEWVRAKRDSFAQAGMLREFEQEYMLRVDSAEFKPFTDDMIRTTDMAPAAWLPRYAIYDPARTVNPEKGDQTGKVVVSRLGSRIIVHESSGHFWKPDEIRTDLFATAERHKCAAVGIEKNSLDDFLMQPIRYEMLKRGSSMTVKPLQAPQDRDKHEFIMGLHPFFAAGEILFVGGRQAHKQLIAQMVNFPAGSLDIINALAYAPRMFAGQVVYEDFGEDNVAAGPEPERGEKIFAAWNASPSDVVCVVVAQHGRHLSVLRDWSATGPVLDAARTVLADLRAAFPRATVENYVPQQMHDETRRIALVPALRELKLLPWRAEATTIARGCLAERIRMKSRERAHLAVDRRALLTLQALAGNYKYAMLTGGRQAQEPEEGLHRLAAEALECLTAMLDKGMIAANPEGASYRHNPQGARYMSTLPERR